MVNFENSSDDWIDRKSRILIPEKFHALGVITVTWSSVEYNIHCIFASVAEIDESLAFIFNRSKNIDSIWRSIIEVAKAKNAENEFIEILKHGQKFTDVCRLNRNDLIHASILLSEHTDGSRVRLASRKRGSWHSEKLIDEVVEIRRVADDLTALNGFLSDTWMNMKGVGLERSAELRIPKIPTRL